MHPAVSFLLLVAVSEVRQRQRWEAETCDADPGGFSPQTALRRLRLAPEVVVRFMLSLYMIRLVCLMT